MWLIVSVVFTLENVEKWLVFPGGYGLDASLKVAM